MEHPILPLRDMPALAEQATGWFSRCWGIPEAEYRESIAQCLRRLSPVPQWYVIADGGRLIAGAGVIENDFHTSFYEQYGWAFLTMVTGDDRTKERMYTAPTLPPDTISP